MLDYLSVTEAVPLCGLRLVLTPGLPGPWSEAAKQIFAVKGIDYVPVAQKVGAEDEALKRWTGQESAPAAVYEEERARTRWYEILLLAERLAPEPPLIPRDEAERAAMFGLGFAICGEDGLGWNLRLYAMSLPAPAAPATDADAAPVFSPAQLEMLRRRYFDASRSGEQALERIRSILALLGETLRRSHARGSLYLVGDRLTAADLYWTIFSNMLAPMAEEICPMPAGYREMARFFGTQLKDALDPALLAHRDEMLARHCVLPMRF